ncbi:hypothetical protein C2G38_2175885 [Gigaspora rosea]|uniref:Uncharacterized protein n=1 Tax=Gigaspora rosea TaxID=44941 RepID=A0A397VIM9_9GLOM|nr:hypothetical protein C2G38_2175885 [Gigaspora rosea]
MSNEGESSQILQSEDSTKIEISESIKLIKPTKLHNGKKIAMLLLSPNSKYAATWSKDDGSIYGWQLDQPAEQSVEQSENEFHQSKPFKFDCSINVKDFCNKYVSLIAVSNNKLIAIQSSVGLQEIIVINFELEAPKKIELKLNPFAEMIE